MPHLDKKLIRLAFRRLCEWCADYARFGREIKPDVALMRELPANESLRVALVCIAKNEDDYINEWIDYHLKLGVDEIFVYQNDWRMTRQQDSRVVHFIEFDGSCRQLSAYNDFIDNHSGEFDFAIFIDVDEFVCLVRDRDIKSFLLKYRGYGAVCLNWRFFGDNGLSSVRDGDYALVNRFTRCGKRLDRLVKTILNLHAVKREKIHFVSPHHLDIAGKRGFAVSVDRRFFVRGPVCWHFNYDIAWINHYHSKTLEEFRLNKCPKGRSDCPRDSSEQRIRYETFVDHNQNEVVNTIARDFYSGKGRPQIAVHVHVYYPGLWPELALCVRNVVDIGGASNVYIFITVPMGAKFIDILKDDFPNAIVVEVPNRGYDVAPFFYVLNKLRLYEFDYVVKLHTKRDVDCYVNFRPLVGGEFRRAALSFCSSHEAMQQSFDAMEKQSDIGMIAGPRVIDPCGYGTSRDPWRMARYVADVGLRPSTYSMVLGTMFMVRAVLLTPVWRRFAIDDFSVVDAENAHRNYGLAAEWEGAFGMLVRAQGFRISDGRHSAVVSRFLDFASTIMFRTMRFCIECVRKLASAELIDVVARFIERCRGVKRSRM